MYDDNILRPLLVKAGSQQIADGLRIRLQGSSNMTLLPDFFVVEIYNITNSDRAALKSAEYLTVESNPGTLLCYGEIDDIYTRQENTNYVTRISVVDGKTFWEQGVSKTVGAGSDLMSSLTNIMSGARFGGWFAGDKRLVRGQTFKGRLADSVSMLARSANARAFLTRGVVYVVEKGKASQTITIQEEDVIDDQNYANGIIMLRTVAKGYSIGVIAQYNGGRYRLVSQKFNLDNYKGYWETTLILADERSLSDEGMVGG